MAKKKNDTGPGAEKGPGETGKIPPPPSEIPTGTDTGNNGGKYVPLDDSSEYPGAGGNRRPVLVRVEPELLAKAAAEAVNINLAADKKKNLHKLLAELTGAEVASGNIGRKARWCIIIGGVVALALPSGLSALRDLRQQRFRKIDHRGQDSEDVSRADPLDRSRSYDEPEEGPADKDMARHVDGFR